MGAADRTVQHLHLRAPSAQAAVHAAHRLEDALRCASLPDAGERLLLVRRLHLGRLPEGLSPQSLSLLIEQRVASMEGGWVPGDEARAALSDAVFFASRLQAAQTALRWRSQGMGLDAWYWPPALPGVMVQAPDAEFLAQLLALLDRGAWAASDLCALVTIAVRHGATRWLTRHLSAGSAAWLVDAVRAGASAAGTVSGKPGRTPVLWRDDRGQPVWLPPLPSGAAWLVQVLHAAGWQAQAASPAAPAWVAGASDPRADAVVSSSSGAVTARAPVPGAGVFAMPRSPHGPVAAPAQGATPVSGRTDTPTWPPHEGGASGAAQGNGPQAWPRLHATAAGGLLFLLPVIARVSVAPPTPPQWRCTLEAALRRLQLPDGDAAWWLVGELPRERDPGLAQAGQAEALRCLHAARHLLRRQLHIGLASLVLRPARLEWTATHWDVHFDVDAADLRVRRAGLDIDPGWCEGLGRVVGFHYGLARIGGHGR